MINPSYGRYRGNVNRYQPAYAQTARMRGASPYLNKYKSMTAIVRHDKMPKFEKAMADRLNEKRVELNLMKKSLESMTELQRLANMYEHKKLPPMKFPLTDKTSLEGMPINRLMELLCKSPGIGDKTIMVKGHEGGFKSMKIKDFLTHGVGLNPNPDYENYFTILRDLMSPDDKRESQLNSANDPRKITIMFPKTGGNANNAVETYKLASEELLSLHMKSTWPNGMPDKDFLKNLEKTRDELNKRLNEIPVGKMIDMRNRIVGTVQKINDALDTTVRGVPVEKEFGAMIWLLDEKHDGLHVKLTNGANGSLAPDIKKRGERQKDLEQTTSTINMAREDGMADTKMLIHHQGEVMKMFIAIADLEKKPVTTMAQHVKGT